MPFSQLALADGLVFLGQGLGVSAHHVTGELVFSTATSGYVEILTDPSYYGQIIVLANPEIGNYGVSFDDFQSSGIKVKGLVVRQLSTCASSWRSSLTLRDWLMRENIPVIIGVDTRAIIAHIREQGSLMAAMAVNSDVPSENLVNTAKDAEPLSLKRLSTQVTVKKPEFYTSSLITAKPITIVALDFGMKRSIITNLLAHCKKLIVLPNDASLEDILSYHPHGLFLSNGPGDPKLEKTAINTVRMCLQKIPIFGICLGHQILALALGYDTYKLKYGHRGSNQAVKCLDDKLITTAQNHGYAVKLSPHDKNAYAYNISDGTNEGLCVDELMAFSVQFHPEGAPGPLDATFYFAEFMKRIMAKNQSVSPRINAISSNELIEKSHG